MTQSWEPEAEDLLTIRLFISEFYGEGSNEDRYFGLTTLLYNFKKHMYLIREITKLIDHSKKCSNM